MLSKFSPWENNSSPVRSYVLRSYGRIEKPIVSKEKAFIKSRKKDLVDSMQLGGLPVKMYLNAYALFAVLLLIALRYTRD